MDFEKNYSFVLLGRLLDIEFVLISKIYLFKIFFFQLISIYIVSIERVFRNEFSKIVKWYKIVL